MIIRSKLTSVSTILILLCVPLTRTKQRVNSAYVAFPPSEAQWLCKLGTYLDGSKARGLSSKGMLADMVSSSAAVDWRVRVFCFGRTISGRLFELYSGSDLGALILSTILPVASFAMASAEGDL